jgi:hypothetical protein
VICRRTLGVGGESLGAIVLSVLWMQGVGGNGYGQKGQLLDFKSSVRTDELIAILQHLFA